MTQCRFIDIRAAREDMVIQFEGQQALSHATPDIENSGEIIWQDGLESPRVFRRSRDLEFSQMVLNRTRVHIELSLEPFPSRFTCCQRSSKFGQIPKTPSPVCGERVAEATAVAGPG